MKLAAKRHLYCATFYFILTVPVPVPITTYQHSASSVTMLGDMFYCYAECRYVKCRGALIITVAKMNVFLRARKSFICRCVSL